MDLSNSIMFSSILLWDRSTYLVAAAAFLLSYLFIKTRRNGKIYNLPPGPLPLPVIGTLYGRIGFKIERDVTRFVIDYVCLFFTNDLSVYTTLHKGKTLNTHSSNTACLKYTYVLKMLNTCLF